MRGTPCDEDVVLRRSVHIVSGARGVSERRAAQMLAFSRLDPEVVESLRWRTSESSATLPYLIALLVALGLAAGAWGIWRVKRALARRRRLAAHGMRRPGARAPGQTPGPPAQGDASPSTVALDPTARARAVLRLIRGEDPATVAIELGITTATLRGWLERFLTAGREALADHARASPLSPHASRKGAQGG